MFNPITEFIAFRRQILARSRLLGAWGFLVNVPPLVGGLMFLNTAAGAAVVVAVPVSLWIALAIHRRRPMSRLIGLCHVVFLPVIALLAGELLREPALSPFGLWVRYCLGVWSACVLLDAFDLFRYFVWRSTTYVEGNNG